MKKIPVSVGLDYADSVVQVCVMDAQGQSFRNGRCENEWQAIAGRVRPEEQVQVAVIEACTGAADLADELMGQAGWPMVMAMPGVVKRMKSNPDKTDWADAKLLADLGRVGYVPRVWLAPLAVRELRVVVRHRQELVNERRAAKLRSGAMLRQQRVRLAGSRWSKPWLRGLVEVKDLSPQGRWFVQQQLRKVVYLAGEIAEVEAHLAAVSGQDWMVRWLMTFKGIGLVTACVIRAEIGSFTRFRSAKSLARFCALTPRNASSGARQADAGVIQAGNAALRTAIIEAAHRLARFEPRWKAMAAALRARGKPGSLVAVAIANRWMRSLYHRGVELEQTAA
jgi:transposase